MSEGLKRGLPSDIRGVPISLFDALEHRVLRRDDGGFEIDLHLKGDDRPVAYLIVHERDGTELWRKLDFSLSTRQDERVKKSYWNMGMVRAVARVLR